MPPSVTIAAAGKASGAVEDRELVRRERKAEDQSAFEELVRRHQHRVVAVAGGILRQREDVEDIAQQVFVKAYFSLKRFDQRAAFSTWLYKITVNECWDLLRKKKVRPLVYESDLSEVQASGRFERLRNDRRLRWTSATSSKRGRRWIGCWSAWTSGTR